MGVDVGRRNGLCVSGADAELSAERKWTVRDRSRGYRYSALCHKRRGISWMVGFSADNRNATHNFRGAKVVSEPECPQCQNLGLDRPDQLPTLSLALAGAAIFPKVFTGLWPLSRTRRVQSRCGALLRGGELAHLPLYRSPIQIRRMEGCPSYGGACLDHGGHRPDRSGRARRHPIDGSDDALPARHNVGLQAGSGQGKRGLVRKSWVLSMARDTNGRDVPTKQLPRSDACGSQNCVRGWRFPFRRSRAGPPAAIRALWNELPSGQQ